MDLLPRYVAFEGDRRLSEGELTDVVRAAAPRASCHPTPVLVIELSSGRTVEVDWRGTPDEVVARMALPPDPPAPSAEADAVPARRGPGRPKLGVVAREVTLLPRHWEWLGRQPGGASVALRKLVETARKANEDVDHAREARDAAYQVTRLLASERPGFEEACRALFANDAAAFDRFSECWPADVREIAQRTVHHAVALDVAAVRP